MLLLASYIHHSRSKKLYGRTFLMLYKTLKIRSESWFSFDTVYIKLGTELYLHLLANMSHAADINPVFICSLT